MKVGLTFIKISSNVIANNVTCLRSECIADTGLIISWKWRPVGKSQFLKQAFLTTTHDKFVTSLKDKVLS